MNTSRLCLLRAAFVLFFAGLTGLAPLSARGQFATLLDTTARYAGNSTGSDVFNGNAGVATATTLNVPSYVAFDSLGNLYISDTQNNCVRKVDTSGNITTVAGLRVSGGADTCNTASNPAPTSAEGLLQPTGLAIDSSNTLYIADSQHNCVRSLASGVVDSFASPALTTVAGTCSSVHTGSNTPLPDGLAVDSSSNLYISIVDSLYAIPVNQVVRHLASDPATTICAVAGQVSPDAANTLCPGVTGTVSLNRPAGLAFDKNGNLFIADTGNNCVREVAGMTTQQTAVGQCANDLSGSSSTALNNPYGLAFSANASLYISESALSRNNVVSFNSGTNSLALIAGLASGASGSYSSSQDGQSATLVPLNQPLGVTTDTGGNIYLADSQNNVVRRMGTNLSFPATNVGSTSPTQTVVFGINQTVNITVTVGTDFNLVSTTCNGSHTSSTTCQVVLSFSPTRPGYRYSFLHLRDSISGNLISVELQGLGLGPLSLLVPGVASTRASGLHTVLAVSTDSAGDAYVLEQGNGSTTADVLFYPAGGGAAQVVVAQGAGMVTPTAMAVDGAGNIFIADSGIGGLGGGNIIRFGADGSVNTSYATGLPGVNAMAVDGFDDLFLAIGGSFHNVTEIYAGGTRHVVAGSGSVVAPNGVPAATAVFFDPSAVALGPNGIAIADAGTHYVYLIDNSGIIHIIAGNGTTSTSTPGLATGTGLMTPDGLAIDAAGDIYIADDAANIVYAVYSVISNGTNINPVIGTGTAGYTGDGGPSNAATIHAPLAIALDGSSNLFVVDSANNALREVTYPVTDTISFGNVLIGTTSAPVLQYLANVGNASLAFSSYPFTPTNSHYAVLFSQTTCTAAVVSGGVCDIAYTFTPTTVGAAPAGQSNLISNSYNSQQTVIFSTSGSSGYTTVPLPFALTNPETEVYGYSFAESWTFSGSLPASGTMVFYIGSQTLCTASISNASAGTITCNAPPSGLAVGSYTVNFTFTSTNSFYSSVTGTTTLNVTRAPLSVTPNNVTRQYGTVNPTFIGSITGAVNGDAFTATYSTTATQFSPVGTYPITATLTPVGSASLSNYTVTSNVGTLTIIPFGSGGSGGLVVTENFTTRPYGQLNPTFTGTVTGLLNGDTVTITYSTTATQFSPVGTYAITAVVSGAAAANYVVTVVPCSLSVTQAGTGGTAGLVVTVNNASRQYGTLNPTFTGTVTGLLNGDSVTITYSTVATQFSPVGTYAITATVSGAAAANYTITVIPGTLTITPAPTPLVITVNNASRPYGQLNPTFTSTVSGLLNGDSVTVTYSTTAAQFSPVGNYAINATVSGPAAANYVITVIPGTLSITQAGTGGTAGLVVTVNNASRPYGTSNPTFTSTVTGLLNGDSVTITYSTVATPASPVGNFAINATVSGPAAANYVITVIPGTLTITTATAPLVVTVNNVTRPYGTPNPTFTSTVTGLLNGDSITITYSTVATPASPVGSYAINATVSGPAAANYVITVIPGTLTITTATVPLVVTVNNASRPYGTANPTFTSSVTGLLNGDSVTITYSTAATQFSPVGNYAINATVSGPAAANYAITVIPGTLTITTATAPLVVTVNNASRPYGTPNPTFTSTITGALNGDTFTITYSTVATPASPVGNYAINATVSGPAAANYAITVIPGTLTITPATVPLVVTVNDATRPYGTPNPTFTSTITGLLNGDSVTVTYSTVATQFSPVGSYAINAVVTGAAAANYSVHVVPGTLFITTATVPLVVTVNSFSRAYGAANPTFTSTVTGLLNGDSVTVTYATAATPASPVGNYAINATVSGPAAANYAITVVPGTLAITPTAPLVVTVNNASRPYGAANPTFTSTIAGAVNGDTFTITYSTVATVASPVGNYAISATVSGANIGSYNVTVVPGTLTITTAGAPLTVTVNNATRPYGTPNPTFTGTITGLLNGDTVTVTYSSTATIASPVGAYPINAVVTGAASANYTVIVNPGTLTITPATTPLVVTVNSFSRQYGTPNPTFTSTITGALNGDTFTITYSTTATIASPVGAYPINATVAGPAAANYAITVVPGSLTITPVAALVVTVNNVSRPYSTPNPTFTSTITGAVNGDTFTVTYATTATLASDAGSYPITATVAGANIANYATVTVAPGTLAITPLATVTTVTTSASPVNMGTSVTFTAAVTYGASLPVAAATVNFYNGSTLLGTGTLNASGVATYTTSALPVGSLTITATYQATLDFASSSATLLQLVNPGSFTLSATPSNQFIRGPGTTVYLVTVSAVQNFNGPVTLACSGLPVDATCTFGTPTVNITNSGATSSVTTTMTVVNTAADARLTLPVLHTPTGRTPSGLAPIAFAAVFPFGLGAFFGLSRRKHGRTRAGRSPRFRLFVALLCTAAIVSLAGCACLSSVYQVYTIPITGTTSVSGVSAQSTSVSLTVAQE